LICLVCMRFYALFHNTFSCTGSSSSDKNGLAAAVSTKPPRKLLPPRKVASDKPAVKKVAAKSPKSKPAAKKVAAKSPKSKASTKKAASKPSKSKASTKKVAKKKESTIKAVSKTTKKADKKDTSKKNAKKVSPKAATVPKKTGSKSAASLASSALLGVSSANNMDAAVSSLNRSVGDSGAVEGDFNAYCTLVDAATNANKYYRLQIVKAASKYYLFKKWGRIGTAGQCSLTPEAGSADNSAIVTEFEKTFKSKTGVAWVQRSSSSAVPGKYTYHKDNGASGASVVFGGGESELESLKRMGQHSPTSAAYQLALKG
jgi:poly [ADP-ribose] polymerase 2/3/4